LDLGQQGLGHIGAARFARFFPSEVMAGVFVPSGTAAGRFAAGAVDGHQAGSQKGPLGLELLEAGVEGPLDQGGMGGDFHELPVGQEGRWYLNISITYQIQGQKSAV
jgi:hypothetical protein